MVLCPVVGTHGCWDTWHWDHHSPASLLVFVEPSSVCLDSTPAPPFKGGVCDSGASQVAQVVTNLPAGVASWIPGLNTSEEEMAMGFSIVAWGKSYGQRNPEQGLQSRGHKKVGYAEHSHAIHGR